MLKRLAISAGATSKGPWYNSEWRSSYCEWWWGSETECEGQTVREGQTVGSSLSGGGWEEWKVWGQRKENMFVSLSCRIAIAKGEREEGSGKGGSNCLWKCFAKNYRVRPSHDLLSLYLSWKSPAKLKQGRPRTEFTARHCNAVLHPTQTTHVYDPMPTPLQPPPEGLYDSKEDLVK